MITVIHHYDFVSLVIFIKIELYHIKFILLKMHIFKIFLFYSNEHRVNYNKLIFTFPSLAFSVVLLNSS